MGNDSNKNIVTTKRIKKIAFAITLTRNGNFADGAIVLAQSIQEYYSGINYDLIAIVSENASSSVPILKNIGYKAHVVKTPINLSNIKNDYYRRVLPISGCCGEVELIKIEIFRLTQYKRVVLLDTDMIFTKFAPELFDETKQILYTYDRAMGINRMKAPCIQGGFLSILPSIDEYHKLINIVQEGDFRDGSGWKGQRYGWCYGGQTIQGLMSYYINELVPQNASQELNSCSIDAMFVSRNFKGEDCSKIFIDSIKLFHFTKCSKPWTCKNMENHIQCKKMYRKWWNLRNQVELSWGINPVSMKKGCENGIYQTIKIQNGRKE